MTFPAEGDWVRWVSVEIQREGQVVRATWPSLVIEWLGVETPQVFPWGHRHFGPGGDMEIIPEPPKAARIAEQQALGSLGIDAAAAALGTTPKRVRQLLRDGKLEGERKGGRWVAVQLPTQSTSGS